MGGPFMASKTLQQSYKTHTSSITARHRTWWTYRLFSEHTEEFHILSGIRLDGFVLIQPSGSYRSQSQGTCFRAQQKKSSTFSQVYKTRWVSSHSTQWLPQKSVSEDLFQSTAEEEFHILRYKTQWVSCFFPFNNLMNLIEL
jgi:hypothetical protein